VFAVFHYRKNYLKYRNLNSAKTINCSFCEDDFSNRLVEETESAYIVHNRVSYDLWESREVIEHLLVVPKAHVTGFAEMTTDVQLDLMDIFGRYEAKGYHVYARGQGNESRTQHHQHTHLIRTKQDLVRLEFALSKPHFLFKI